MRIILDNTPALRKTAKKKTAKRSNRKMIECENCHKKTYADARFCHLCGSAIRAKSKQVDILAVAFVLFSAALGLIAFWILQGGQLPD